MNFKQPSSDKLTNHATMFGGVAVGAMISRGAISAIHKPVGTDAATIKKEETMLLVKRGVLILAAGYAGAGIDGNDTFSILTKGACLGVAAMQAVDAVKDYAAKSGKLTDTSTPTKRILAKSLGLGCACDAQAPMIALGKPRNRRRSLGMPVMDAQYQPAQNLSVIQY